MWKIRLFFSFGWSETKRQTIGRDTTIFPKKQTQQRKKQNRQIKKRRRTQPKNSLIDEQFPNQSQLDAKWSHWFSDVFSFGRSQTKQTNSQTYGSFHIKSTAKKQTFSKVSSFFWANDVIHSAVFSFGWSESKRQNSRCCLHFPKKQTQRKKRHKRKLSKTKNSEKFLWLISNTNKQTNIFFFLFSSLPSLRFPSFSFDYFSFFADCSQTFDAFFLCETKQNKKREKKKKKRLFFFFLFKRTFLFVSSEKSKHFFWQNKNKKPSKQKQNKRKLGKKSKKHFIWNSSMQSTKTHYITEIWRADRALQADKASKEKYRAAMAKNERNTQYFSNKTANEKKLCKPAERPDGRCSSTIANKTAQRIRSMATEFDWSPYLTANQIQNLLSDPDFHFRAIHGPKNKKPIRLLPHLATNRLQKPNIYKLGSLFWTNATSTSNRLQKKQTFQKKSSFPGQMMSSIQLFFRLDDQKPNAKHTTHFPKKQTKRKKTKQTNQKRRRKQPKKFSNWWTISKSKSIGRKIKPLNLGCFFVRRQTKQKNSRRTEHFPENKLTGKNKKKNQNRTKTANSRVIKYAFKKKKGHALRFPNQGLQIRIKIWCRIKPIDSRLFFCLDDHRPNKQKAQNTLAFHIKSTAKSKHFQNWVLSFEQMITSVRLFFRLDDQKPN